MGREVLTPEMRNPNRLSRRAKEAISGFSKQVLQVAELVRLVNNFPKNAENHFFTYNMNRFGYFQKEAEPAWMNEEHVPPWTVIDGDTRFVAIGGIAFSGRAVGLLGKEDPTFTRSTSKLEEELLVEFLNGLGFIKGKEITGEPIKDASSRERIRIPHPTLPFVAEYSYQTSQLKTSNVWFEYHEDYEHQLAFDLTG